MSKAPCSECGEIQFQKVQIRYKKLKKCNPLRERLEARGAKEAITGKHMAGVDNSDVRISEAS